MVNLIGIIVFFVVDKENNPTVSCGKVISQNGNQILELQSSYKENVTINIDETIVFMSFDDAMADAISWGDCLSA